MDKFNIFLQIIQNENDLVNVLHALLVYEPFRKLFFELLTGEKDISIKWEDIASEYRLEQGRPDLVILNKHIIIFIEIKFTEWCKLTQNQPDGYIHELKKISDNRKKLLVFLLPPNYFHKKTIDQCLQDNSNLDGLPKVSIVSWGDIIDLLENNELIYLNSNFRHFYEWLKYRYCERPISFSYEEIEMIYQPQLLTFIKKLTGLVEVVLDEIKNSGYSVSYSFQKDWWNSEYGGYISINKIDVLWFGIWPEFWEKHDSHAPLCFGVHKGEWNETVVKKFEETYPNFIVFREVDIKPYLVVPIEKRTLFATNPKNEILKEIFSWLNKIENILQAQQ